MSSAEIERLLAALDDVPYASPVAISLLEEAVRVADASNDSEQAYELREDLMSRMFHTGDWDRLLVHFGYCLAASDREPDRFSEEDLLWTYKWVVNEAVRMPAIQRQQALGLLADFERRVKAHGGSLRPIHEHRAIVLAKLGDLDEVRPSIEAWFDARRDVLADCRACELDTRVELLQQLGEHELAYQRAAKLIAAKSGCAEIPHRTLARTLGYLRETRPELAERYHKRGYRLCKSMKKLVEAHAQHLLHAAVTERDQEAVNMVERHLADVLAHPSAWERVVFLAALRRTAELWQERSRPHLALRLPDALGLGDAPSSAAIEAWAGAELERNVRAFDQRNGNTAVSTWAGQWHLRGA